MLSTKRTNQTILGLEQAPLKEQKAAAGEMPQAPVWHRAPAAVQGPTQHPEGRTPTQENGERRDGHVPGRDVHAVDLEKVATQLHVKPRSKATRLHQNGQRQRTVRRCVRVVTRTASSVLAGGACHRSRTCAQSSAGCARWTRATGPPVARRTRRAGPCTALGPPPTRPRSAQRPHSPHSSPWPWGAPGLSAGCGAAQP